MDNKTEIAKCVQRARQLRQTENMAYADEYRNILDFDLRALPIIAAEANGALGAAALVVDDFGQAIAYFEKAIDISPNDNEYLYFDLGQAFEASDQQQKAYGAYLKAHQINPQNARYHLYAGAMAYQIGDTEIAAQIWSLGNDLDPILTTAHLQANMDVEIAVKSKLADQQLRLKMHDLHQQACAKHKTPRVEKAIWIQTDPKLDAKKLHFGQDLPYKLDNQKPHFFYMPDLQAQPVFDDLPYFDALVKHQDDILGEFLQAQDIQGTPYIHGQMRGQEWAKLAGDQAWQSVHLYQNGQLNQDIAPRFTKTLDAITSVPMPEIDGNPIEAFFSVLAPDTHIPPHFGLSNCRLTVHLPLIIPENCGIRVADDTHQWQMGKVFAFDDSFEHEAWNKSQETRVVLILEAWHPDVSDDERTSINEAFDARTDWLKARNIPKV